MSAKAWPALSRIIGQERAVTLLSRMLASRQGGRVYLFSGPDGVGKLAAAQALAAAWFCHEPQGPGGIDACGSCPACRKLIAGSHPDLTVIEPAPDKEKIGIETARELIKSLHFAPLEAEVRFVLIPDAERLTLEAANSLLKTLEEPPAHTLIILTAASAEMLPPTVLSRCQTLAFRPLAAELLAAEVSARHDIAPERARLAAALAGGSLKAAAGVDPEEMLQQRDELLACLEGLSLESPEGLFSLAQEVTKQGRTKDFLALLAAWHRDLLVSAAGAGPEGLINRDLAARLAGQAGAASPLELAQRLWAVFEAEAALAANANPRLALEALLLKIHPERLAQRVAGVWREGGAG